MNLRIDFSILMLVLLMLLWAGSAYSVDVPFSSQKAINISAASAENVIAVDMDGDGDMDVVSTSLADDKVAWYENDGSQNFAFHIIVSSTIGTPDDGVRGLFATDLDRDGDTDLLTTATSSKVSWYENDGNQNFAFHIIASSTTGVKPFNAQSVKAVDMDGDGDLDVISGSFSDDKVAWYENDGSQNFAYHTIVSSTVGVAADGVRSVFTSDLDRDGDMDVLSASQLDDKIAWYENDGSQSFSTNIIASTSVGTAADGAKGVVVEDIDGDGDMDVLSSSFFDDRITWYENDGSQNFTTHDISNTANQAESVFAKDMDGDGDIDVLSVSSADHKVAWYENDGSQNFAFHIIVSSTIGTAADGASSVFAEDMDGDGDIDILSSSKNDDKIAWYENQSIHRSAEFPTQATINSSTEEGAYAVITADLDRDGDMDVLSASENDDKIAWYENDGNQNFAYHIIVSSTISSSAFDARDVFVDDVDRDGDMDVLSASSKDDKIAWYENDGSQSFTPRILASTSVGTPANGANSVRTTDLDGDGDMDVLFSAAFEDKIAWYENDGSQNFALHIIVSSTIGVTPDNPNSVFATDLDRDGDIDVLSSSFADDKIAWYENDGSQNFAFHIIASTTTGTPADGARDVTAKDVDRDGDMDVLSASFTDGRIAWYENDGSQNFTAHTITSTASGMNGVFADDVDGDGDIDVFSSSFTNERIAWYENDGSQNFVPHIIVSTTIGVSAGTVRNVFASDVDGDGDIDVLSAADKIEWYENKGGHFSLATTDSLDKVIGDSSTDDVFKVVATHEGRAGDSNIELATFDLLFEETTSDPLTTAEANAVVENLLVYKDTGSGVFESGSDTLVTTVATLSLTSGVQTVTFTDSDANVQIAQGTPATYFVVVELTANATSQSPSDFQITHQTESTSEAEDTTNDSPLQLQFALNTVSQVSIPNFNLSKTTATVTEAGGTDSFTVVLDASPTSNVEITITSADTGEATVSPSPLTFTTANWSSAQTVTLTGVDDVLVDGSVNTTVTVSVNDANSDDDFDSLADKTVTVTTTDDDTAGFVLSKTSAAVTEAGGTDTFTVVLNTQPLTNVEIDITSSDTSEATISPSPLTFTNANWNSAQTVTVTGVDDFEDDGGQVKSATVSVNDANSDNAFDPVADQFVSITTTDDDPADNADPLFGAHSQTVITTNADETQYVFAVDMDKDGDMDVISASELDDKIAWYENDGSQNFSPHTIVSSTIGTAADGALFVVAEDVDSDGDMDVISASQNDNRVAWYENDGSQNFTTHTVINHAGNVRSVFASDVDGDGDMDMLSGSQSLDMVAWYENDGSQNFAFHIIVSSTIGVAADGVQTVIASDVDGDGDIDVLSASASDDKIAWYENDGSQNFAFHIIASSTISTAPVGAQSVFAKDVDRDGDMDVLSAAFTGDAIAWYENDGSQNFTAHIINHSANGASTVRPDDVDGDGDIDVLSASNHDDKIAWYENDGSQNFAYHIIVSSTIGVGADGGQSVFTADVDGDGDIDVLSSSLNDDKIAWYENESIHRSAEFPAQTVISASAVGAWSVFTIDLDKDGDMDVLSASEDDDKIAWYENDGSQSFTTNIIASTSVGTAADGARDVYGADMDGDGDIDVLSAANQSGGTIKWYENDGSQNFTTHNIQTSFNSARSVMASDMDGDGDMDVLSAASGIDTIAWHENDGSQNFAYQIIVSSTIGVAADGVSSVYAVDMDRDGDTDVVATSANDDKVSWYENDGSQNFAFHIIASPTIGSTTPDGARSVYAEDVDGDGDMDVLAAAFQKDNITWYENDGSQNFTHHTIRIESFNGATSILAGDVDGDGDIDVLSTSSNQDRVEWYENDGSQNFASHVIVSTTIGTPADGAQAIHASDLDGDGDLDILSASTNDDKIAWYENKGGHFSLETSDTLSDTIIDSATDDVFKIIATHEGRAGDSNIELATFDLLFEETTSDPLTTAEANALVDKLLIYKDTGSGVFEVGSDTLVTTVATLLLVSGVQTVTFTDSDANVQLPQGTPATYFVVVELTSNATAQTPRDFQITHQTESTSKAEDAANDSPLQLQFAANVVSPLSLPGFTLSKTTATVTEAGGTDTFTVVLDATPASNVVFSVTSVDTGETTVSPSSLTFTNANWNSAQTVTLTGVDDITVDGSVNTSVTISVDDAASDDGFDPLADQSVTATTTDDDVAGFTLSKTSAAVTEAGGTDTFTVVLNNQPLTNVEITITSGDTSEATFAPSPLTFTNANWNSAQTVTVTGVDDVIDDGGQVKSAVISVNDANSDDAFDPAADQTVSVTTSDDDPADNADPAFGAHSQIVISTNADGAREVITADVDGDGDMDVLSASFWDDKIAWYENDGSQNFSYHIIVSSTISESAFGVRHIFADDVDRDGDMDVLSASQHDDKIAWYENDGSQSFTPRILASTTVAPSANGASSVMSFDMDGDGDKDVLTASQVDDKIAWYENDGNQNFAFHIIVSSTIGVAADKARSVFAIDLDKDGDADVLSASFDDDKIAWYENDGSQNFAFHIIASTTISTTPDGALWVTAEDVDGDGDNDVLSASFTDGRIAWYENDGSQNFTAHTISSNDANAYKVVAEDMDGDGDIDVLTVSQTDDKVAWYENDGSQNFAPHIIVSSTIGVNADKARSVFASDLDGDGDIDVLSASFDDDKIAWYENETIHRSAEYPAQTVISATADGARSVFAIDVDNDGDMDVLSASNGDDSIKWYQNDGNQNYTKFDIAAGTTNGAQSVYAIDVDGDGDMDVLSASNNDDTIAWYNNDGSQSFTKTDISNTANGNRSVFAIDVDKDGDIDVLSASGLDDKIAWYENDGSQNFSSHIIVSSTIGTPADDVWSVYATDMDSDGDIDVLSASIAEDKIAWYENDGNQNFAFHIIVSSTIGTAADDARSVYAIDVDSDGDMDVLSASQLDDKIAWYENDGSQNFTDHTITTADDNAVFVYAFDVDGDGDIDVLSASNDDDSISWYENDGSQDFTTHDIITTANGAGAVFAEDIDSDGDIDVLSASFSDDKIAWYENKGGHFSLETTDSFTATITDNATDDVLKIIANHEGRAGDSNIELATFDLLLEETTSDPLTTAEANALVDKLLIYKDTGSGVFEAGSDTLVTTVATLSLASGVQTITFTDNDANVQLPQGTPATYFVVVELTANATAQTPRDFQITHRTESTSKAEDTTNDSPLQLQFATNVVSPLSLPGFTLSKTTASVTEAGGTDTYTVVLDTQPASNVVLSVTSADTGEATISPSPLTFTNANWNSAQTVTVTGVDDFVDDGSINTTVTISVDDAASDNNFDSLADETVTVTTTDDDTAGFTLTKTTATVTEAGTTDTFGVVLNSQPTSNVVLSVTSANTNEATVSPAPLTFTTANWNATQTITVTGVDDAVDDGSINTTVTISVDDAASDNNFDSLADETVTVTTTDDDTAGFTLTKTTVTVTEAGGTDTLGVVLNAQPTSNVVLSVTSANTNEATVSPAPLTFTTANWNATQTITVTGVDDAVDDGNQNTTVTISVDDAASDNTFDPLGDQTVTVTTTDDDTAGFTLTKTTVTVTEAGGTDTFGVVLNAQPTSNVVLSVTSANTSEATISPAPLTFTTANWNATQTVTVTGVDDAIDDGDQNTTVTISVDDAASDNNFDPLGDQTVTVTTTDDDTAGFTLTKTTASVGESGTTDTFGVVLNSQPTSNVVLSVTSANTNEATVSPVPLTFTTANWNAAQTVTVTGVDDAIDDGNINTTVTISVDDAASDNNFDPLGDQTVTVTTTDDDTAGFTLTKTTATVTEAGGTDTFGLVLNSQPTSNVVLSVTSANTSEATISPAPLTFTTANWNATQTVTVTGVDDAIDDGDQNTTVTISVDDAASDNNFDPLGDQTVTVTTTDDDVAGFTLTKTTASVTEAGGTDTFGVVLNSQPTSNVVLSVTSANTSEATVSPAPLTFTTANWNAAQTVTVTGVDDAIDDGNINTTVTISVDDAASDNNFDPLGDQTVTVTTTDDDTAGFTLTKTTVTVTEAGGTDTFGVVLNAQPTSNVVLSVTSANTNEATVSPAPLTFTTANWNATQTITVTGVDDAVDDGNQNTTVTISVDDAASDNTFDPLGDQTVTVTTTDDDTAGFTLTKTTVTVTEAGGTDTFGVVLNAQPTSNVVLSVTSANTSEATISPAPLTFTTANWNATQTVTVTGVDDAIDDGDQNTTVTISVDDAASDNNFDPLGDQTVTVTTTDDDTAGFTLTKTTASVGESGTTDTFGVVLNSQPTSNVVLSVTSANTNEATVSPVPLTFTTANWNAAQTVTVTGVDDAIDDGNINTTVTISVDDAASDNNFDPLGDQTVTVTTTDDDTAGFTLTKTTATVTEAGGTDTFGLVLNSQPTSNVVLSVTSADTGEATVSPAPLTFTTANWNATQTVTVTGVDDAIDDGDQNTTVTISVDDVASDNNFDPLGDQTVTVTTTDDDTAGFTLTKTTATVTEAGGTDTFGVVLNAQPTSNVVLSVTSANTSEATVSPAPLTFTTANWNATQTVTVTGVDDAIDDGDQNTTVTISVDDAASDNNFDPLGDQTVTVTTTDDDTAGFTLSKTTASVGENGTTDTFTVVLNKQPTSNVLFTVISADIGEVTVSSTTLTFTTGNWNSLQTVTVTGVDDSLDDGDQNTIITISVDDANSDDAFDPIADKTIAITTTDDDNTAPVISNLNGDSITFYKNSVPQIFDQNNNAEVTDIDSTDFNGGNITVTIVTNKDGTEDVLSLKTAGVIDLASTVAGSTVSVNNSNIGTIANSIAAGNDLVINFNAAATPDTLSTILQNLTYQNIDAVTPSINTRTLRITINDGDGATSIQTDVSVIVDPNQIPKAVNDTVSTNEDNKVQISSTDLQVNDSDADGDPLIIIGTSGAVNGVVTFVSPTIIFTPNANFNGTASFIYTVSDGKTTTNGTVTVSVIPVNDVPVLMNKTVDVFEGTTTPISVSASDVDGDTLTYELVSGPSDGGTINGVNPNGTFFYTPPVFFVNQSIENADTFTYRVSDGTTFSTAGTVTINVINFNDPPTAIPISVWVIQNEITQIQLKGIDGNGDSIIYTIASLPLNGNLSNFSLGNGTINYKPSSGFTGNDSFTFTVSDNELTSSAVTVNIAVLVAAPTFTPIPLPTVVQILETPTITNTPVPTLTPTPTLTFTHNASPTPTITNTPRPNNSPPEIISVSNEIEFIEINSELFLNLFIRDIDGDFIQMSHSDNAPIINSFIITEIGYAVVKFEIDTTVAGGYSFTVIAYDGSSTTTQQFNITVFDPSQVTPISTIELSNTPTTIPTSMSVTVPLTNTNTPLFPNPTSTFIPLTPTSTIIPIPNTPIPPPTASNTGIVPTDPPLMTPTTSTSEPIDIAGSYLEIFDNMTSTQNIAGGSDIDLQGVRDLVIRWNLSFPTNDVKEFHTYVRTNGGSVFEYLGQALGSSASFLEWTKDSSQIATKFRQGPIPGNTYEFIVYILTISGTVNDYGPITSSFPIMHRPEQPLLPELQRFDFGAVSYEKNIDALQSSLLVRDHAGSATDVTGRTDFDPINKQELTIEWIVVNINANDIKDYHVYVRQNQANRFEFLGNTKDGDINQITWNSGNKNITERFSSGPQPGNHYEFIVYPLTVSGIPHAFDPITASGSIQYPAGALVSGDLLTHDFGSVTCSSAITVTDDSTATVDLSSSHDIDALEDEALAIRWMVDELILKGNTIASSLITDVHIFVEVDGAPLAYVGRTGNGMDSVYEWRADNNNIVTELFATGPQSGSTYRFAVFFILNQRDANNQFLKIGPCYTAGNIVFNP